MWQKCPVCEGTGVDPTAGLPYNYRTTPLTLNGNATGTQFITLANWDFLWQEFTGESTGAFTFLISDVGNASRQFSNVQIHSSELVGSGTAPFPLLVPYRWKTQNQIRVDFTDVSGSSNTIALCFIGVNLGEGQNQ